MELNNLAFPLCILIPFPSFFIFLFSPKLLININVLLSIKLFIHLHFFIFNIILSPQSLPLPAYILLLVICLNLCPKMCS